MRVFLVFFWSEEVTQRVTKKKKQKQKKQKRKPHIIFKKFMDKNSTHVFMVRSFSWSFYNYFEIVFMTLSGIIEHSPWKRKNKSSYLHWEDTSQLKIIKVCEIVRHTKKIMKKEKEKENKKRKIQEKSNNNKKHLFFYFFFLWKNIFCSKTQFRKNLVYTSYHSFFELQDIWNAVT